MSSNKKVTIRPLIVLDQKTTIDHYWFHIYYVTLINMNQPFEFLYQPHSTVIQSSVILKSHKFQVYDFEIKVDRNDTEVQYFSFKLSRSDSKSISVQIPSKQDDINVVFLDNITSYKDSNVDNLSELIDYSNLVNNTVLCLDVNWNNHSIFHNKQIISYLVKRSNNIVSTNLLLSFIKHVTIIELIKTIFTNNILSLQKPCVLNFNYYLNNIEIFNDTIYNLEKEYLETFLHEEQYFQLHNTKFQLTSLSNTLINHDSDIVFTPQNIVASDKSLLKVTDYEYNKYINQNKL